MAAGCSPGVTARCALSGEKRPQTKDDSKPSSRNRAQDAMYALMWAHEVNAWSKGRHGGAHLLHQLAGTQKCLSVAAALIQQACTCCGSHGHRSCCDLLISARISEVERLLRHL